MSTPHTPIFKSNAMLIPTINDITEARHFFPTPEPGQLSPDSTQTVQVDLDPGTTIEGGKVDIGSESVGQGQLQATCQQMEDKRRTMHAAIALAKEESIVTARIGVTGTSTTPVHLGTYTSDAPLMPPTVVPVMSPSTSASVTHSLYHHHNGPTSWWMLMDHIQSLSTTSSLLSMQPLPKLGVKKPLQFKQQKEQKEKVRRGLLWMYALPDKEHVEDRQHADTEKLALLEHHTPITCSLICDFLTGSG